MITIAVLTAIGELHLHAIETEPEKFVSDNYGENCQWQQIFKAINHKDDKPYIFLTSDGQTKDGSGSDVENCQYLAIAKGPDVLTAYNNMLSDHSWSGDFDTCFAYQLTSENMSHFDLINDESDNDEVCHCNKCDKAIGLSDFEIGDGKCKECNKK